MYRTLPSSEIELCRVSPVVSHPSLRNNLSSHHSAADDIYFRASDDEYLLNPLNRRTDAGPVRTRVASDKAWLPFKNKTTRKFQNGSKKTNYSPFTVQGRELLRRKLMSSGPANFAQRLPGEDIDGESETVEKLAGWRKGTWLCCSAVILCILTELVLLIWAVKTSIGHTGSGLLYEGNCDKTKNLAIWLLLPLNVVATVLIGTSNYVMQIMTAPSRNEIDQAHRHVQGIIIGGMSFLQNLGTGRDARSRRVIWWTLVMSSLPIHLLLNSAIYSSVQASNIGVLVVSSDFETDSSWANCSTTSTENSPSSSFSCELMQKFMAGQTKQMSPSQCILQYANGFQTNASSVIVVAAAGANPWYNPPKSHSVPFSYGLACEYANFTESAYQYVAVPDSERNFRFTYNEAAGNVTVSLPFYTQRKNTTNNCSLVQDWNLSPDDQYNSTGTLFYTASDTLSHTKSIRSVFDAIDYRYWATADVTGDYLDVDYEALSEGLDTRSWLCPADDLVKGLQCDTNKLLGESGWSITPSSIPVSECHVLPKQELCTLRYSWRILLITICCDIVKLAAMISATAFISKPLTTLGDVIASFLQEPDPCTRSCGLLDDEDARRLSEHWKSKRPALIAYLEYIDSGKQVSPSNQLIWRRFNFPYSHSQAAIQFQQDSRHWIAEGGSWWAKTATGLEPRPWVSPNKRWFAVLSRMRWITFGVLYFSLTTLAVIYISLSLRSLQRRRLSNIWMAGFSGPDPNALWNGGLLSNPSNVTGAAISVNLPQLLFSMLYFFFNATFTLMHTAHEWAEFTKHRKALRVSSPRGSQRSTYWLQLPWAYSLPLAVACGSLHWLLGRSIYLIKVEVYGYFGERQVEKDFFACGFSSVTVLALLVLLLCMGLALLIVAFRRLGSGSPLVKFNSLAISAACQPDSSEKNVVLHPLMWGVLQDEHGLDTRHCSFSARAVSPLVGGVFYA